MSFLSKSSSQGDCKGSKAPPSKHVSKGAEGTGSSFPGFPSKMKNPFAKRSEGSKASSDSQQPSPNNENPETDTEPALSQHVSKGAEGTGSSFPGFSSKMKNPFKKRSEGSKARSDSQQPSPNNENPETDTEPALSQHVSKGAEGTGSSFPGFSSKMKNPFAKRSEGSKASSDSQQPSTNNENPETDTEPALSQHVSKGAEGTGSLFPGFSSKMKNPFAKRSEGSKASSDSQQPSQNNENPETDTESALSQHVSKAAEGTGSLFPGFSSKMKNPFAKRSEGKASNDSQQPSPNNENPETDTEPALSQDADGKITFKPKDLLSNISEEERRQAWTISESSRDVTAEMLEVCWLDVTGSMTATKGKAYEISFILSMNEENSFGWEDPVYVMARIGEEGEYTRVQIDLSKLGREKEEFPAEKCRVEFRSDENAENNKKKLYFGLYEVWTNNWKGGLRIHEAIVRELTAVDSASTSNTLSDDSKVQEVTVDKSTSASENPPELSIMKQVQAPPDEVVAQKITVHDSASTSTNHVDDFAAASREEYLQDEFFDSKDSLEDK
nr:uncharacterized protein LOC118045217 isoform X3 [Populus alba]